MKTEVIELLNYRIQQEQLSSRIYEQMSLWLDNEGYVGSSQLWSKYTAEELKHANFAKEYLLSFGVCPKLRTLDVPDMSYTCLCDIIDKTFSHEEEITRQCNVLATRAMSAGDHGLYTLAAKYCAEQVEEMSKAQTLKDLVRTFGDDKISMKLLDNHLGTL